MDLTGLDDLLGYHARRASQLMMAALATQLAELGLRVTEATVLVVLGTAPFSSQSDIGRILAIKRANMTPIVAGLIARGLIERANTSGRSHPLRLTATGEDLAAAARRVMAEHDAVYFHALDPAQRAWLTELLSSIWRATPDAADDSVE